MRELTHANTDIAAYSIQCNATKSLVTRNLDTLISEPNYVSLTT